MEETKKDYWECVCLSRADIEERGYDASSITDEQMARMASKLGDCLMEGGEFWEFIDVYCEEILGLVSAKYKEEKLEFVKEHLFLALTSFMESCDATKVADKIAETVLEDCIESAGYDFTNSDVRIGLSRVILNKLDIED